MDDYSAYAAACIERLERWYNDKKGEWESTGWWNNANILHAIIDYATFTKIDRFNGVISNIFEKRGDKKFLNDYYDDEGWWALTWIRAYDLTHDMRYLAMAETIFKDISKLGWDNQCGGGVWWNRKREYKNAIANELFLTAAARLYLRTNNNIYCDKYDYAWSWLQTSGLISSDHLIYDRLNNDCSLGDRTTWTYNQGVILGGLVEMYSITDEVKYLNTAQDIAQAAMNNLVDGEDILNEPDERDREDRDAPQFKGIFMRNLAYLCQTISSVYGAYSYITEPYKQFIRHNVSFLWEKSRSSDNEFGYNWGKPFDKADAMRQSAALDAFNAALSVLTD